jgi:hypothetical protein
MEDILLILGKCKKEVVEKFLGNPKINLSYSQLHKLSDEIFVNTKISISHSTLKRIFNENYRGTPQLSTLDAFAKYLGYADWNDYFRKNINTTHLKKNKPDSKTQKRAGKFILLILAILLLGITGYFIFSKRLIDEPNLQNIEFSCLPFDSTEMPVVVHFRYNIKNIKCDTALIHPIARYGWSNGLDVIQIDPKDSTARYIYLWPEVFTPLLTVDGKIVGQLNVRLKTKGWQGELSNEKSGYYVKFFYDKEIFTKGTMSFTNEVFVKNNFTRDDIERMAFNNYNDFTRINGDSLHFETRIKLTPFRRNEKTGGAEIHLTFENIMIFLPLEPKIAPFKEFWFFPFDNYLSSQDTDLTFLYKNIEEYTNIKIVTKEKNFYLYFDDSLIYKIEFTKDPGMLMGMRFAFRGMGEVDYVRFFNQKGEMIYHDEFD